MHSNTHQRARRDPGKGCSATDGGVHDESVCRLIVMRTYQSIASNRSSSQVQQSESRGYMNRETSLLFNPSSEICRCTDWSRLTNLKTANLLQSRLLRFPNGVQHPPWVEVPIGEFSSDSEASTYPLEIDHDGFSVDELAGCWQEEMRPNIP
jgi:hypothetical protein